MTPFTVRVEDHVLERDCRFPKMPKNKLVKLIIKEVLKSRLIEFQPDGRERRVYRNRVYVTRYDPIRNTQTVITVLLTKATLRHTDKEERKILISGGHSQNRPLWASRSG